MRVSVRNALLEVRQLAVPRGGKAVDPGESGLQTDKQGMVAVEVEPQIVRVGARLTELGWNCKVSLKVKGRYLMLIHIVPHLLIIVI
jgi:hypothetical protein